MKNYLLLLATQCVVATFVFSQEDEKMENKLTDSLYIIEVENLSKSPKVLHAEPLYIDLIRDLGARKGEREWNVGMGLMDNNTYDRYEALVEYEWAPINRLGLEIEIPFSFYYASNGNGNAPSSKMNSLKMAGQYTFLISEKRSTSMAIGYIQEFELTDFRSYNSSRFFQGNVYNPFLIIAKRWGTNFHTLLYTGPSFQHHFSTQTIHPVIEINSNVHYMIPGTRNFVGIEFNKEIDEFGDFDMTIRPQMRVSISENLLIGIVTGIPISKKNERFSSFLRLIYEPKHRK